MGVVTEPWSVRCNLTRLRPWRSRCASRRGRAHAGEPHACILSSPHHAGCAVLERSLLSRAAGCPQRWQTLAVWEEARRNGGWRERHTLLSSDGVARTPSHSASLSPRQGRALPSSCYRDAAPSLESPDLPARLSYLQHTSRLCQGRSGARTLKAPTRGQERPPAWLPGTSEGLAAGSPP